MTVDFRQILCDSSKKVAEIAASCVLDEPERIKQVTEIMLADEYPYSHRAARVMEICSGQFPELFDKQQNNIIPALQKVRSEGIIRGILKIVADCPVKLSKKNRGILLGLCFDWLNDLSKPVSIRVHSMQFLYNISVHEKDIRDELISILEAGYADGSAGFRSRADKILRKLYHL
ncbi:MAG: hypothetical protein A2Y87_05535 [Bacteroidetes bacterium RBG_13_46_8]|nr:MAG: hypothetical protein A2Y87_05535 [Bacteroidetes bacterium RBG_13_46_8]